MASAEAADLQVDFLRGDHGDDYPFDGAGGAVGHAFFPSDPAQAGRVHLDAEEEWAFRQPGEAKRASLTPNFSASICPLPLFWRVSLQGYIYPSFILFY